MRVVNMLIALVAIERTPQWLKPEQAQEVMAKVCDEIATANVDEILGAITVQQ